jgi:hypothetical protein
MDRNSLHIVSAYTYLCKERMLTVLCEYVLHYGSYFVSGW